MKEHSSGTTPFSIDYRIVDAIRPVYECGLKSVMLFGVVGSDGKDTEASLSSDPDRNPVHGAIRVIRANFPDLVVACDVCLCAYTSHGHCGILSQQTGVIDMEKSDQRLAQMALSFARSGAHVVAPSDMMVSLLAIHSNYQSLLIHRTSN